MIIDPQWAWLAAAGGLIATCWSTVKQGFDNLRGLVVGRIEAESGNAVNILQSHLLKHGRFLNRANRNYGAFNMHVRPVSKFLMCAFEMVCQNQSVVLYRGKILLVHIRHDPNGHRSDTMVASYLRWTLDPDQFMNEATDEYNERQAVDSSKSSGERRYRIELVSGMSHFIKNPNGNGQGNQPHNGFDGDTPEHASMPLDWVMAQRWLKWSVEELGSPIEDGAQLIDVISMPPSMQEPIQEIERWLKSKEWYRQRHIPWKRGWLLRGKPGTGKSTMVKAIAQKYDLPLYVYDLASLSNEDLRKEWQKMLAKAPCIAVFEDLDAVFQGRENVTKNMGFSALTFDCLLNVISGVDNSDGVFTCITTNRPEMIDEALGVVDDSGRSSRPGRIDRILELGPLDEAGRRKMAERIAAGFPALIDELVISGDGETPAQFQERCCQATLEAYWKVKDQEAA